MRTSSPPKASDQMTARNHTALSVPSIAWRAVAAAVSLAIGFQIIDAEWAGGLPPVLRLVGMFVLILYGAATGAQVLRALLGLPPITWFPQATNLGGMNGLLPFLVVSALILATVFALGAVAPHLEWRPAVGGFGVLCCFIAFARTRGFWNNPEVEALRELIGDRTVQFFSMGLGLLAVGAALFGGSS